MGTLAELIHHTHWWTDTGPNLLPPKHPCIIQGSGSDTIVGMLALQHYPTMPAIPDNTHYSINQRDVGLHQFHSILCVSIPYHCSLAYMPSKATIEKTYCFETAINYVSKPTIIASDHASIVSAWSSGCLTLRAVSLPWDIKVFLTLDISDYIDGTTISNFQREYWEIMFSWDCV